MCMSGMKGEKGIIVVGRLSLSLSIRVASPPPPQHIHRAKHHFTPHSSLPSAAAAEAAAEAATAPRGAVEMNGDGGGDGVMGTPPTPFMYGAIAPVVLGGGEGELEDEEEKRRQAALYRLRQQQLMQRWRDPRDELTYAQVRGK